WLEVVYGMTWWKGLRVDDQSLELTGIGNYPPATPNLRKGPITLAADDLTGRWLILSKAKFLGFHRDVYKVDLTEFAGYNGQNVVFQWAWDSAGYRACDPDPVYAAANGQPNDKTLLQDYTLTSSPGTRSGNPASIPSYTHNGPVWVVLGNGLF